MWTPPAEFAEQSIVTDHSGKQWLSSLAEETGGLILLPGSIDEMVKRSDEIAHEIDSQYVVTYTPKRPLALVSNDEFEL